MISLYLERWHTQKTFGESAAIMRDYGKCFRKSVPFLPSLQSFYVHNKVILCISEKMTEMRNKEV
jgi:hypothetical protein